jgi:hypothetical protein
MMSSTEARGYRVTVTVTDKRSTPPLQLAHTVEVVSYDATDALIQAGFVLHQQGLFDPNDTSGFDLRLANVQPTLPPYSTLMGAAKGSLDERLAKFLNSQGY